MSTSLDAEALQGHTWLERARCAAVGLTIHSAVILTCLLTVNPVLKGQDPVFLGFLSVFVFIDLVLSFCFFYGLQTKNRWFILPIMIKQGVDAVIRSLMLLLLIIWYASYVVMRYYPERGYEPPSGPLFQALQMAYLLPFNVISIFCLVKAFGALRPSSSVHVPPRDSVVIKTLQSFLWIERARCVAIGFSIRVGIAFLYVMKAIALPEQQKCLSVAVSAADTFILVLCLACCFRGLNKMPYSQWWLLPITISQGLEVLGRAIMIIQIIFNVDLRLLSSSEETCTGMNQAVAFYLPLHIIAFYCFAKVMMIISRGIPSLPATVA